MRKDGKRVTNLDSIHKIMPHLMKNRCEAEVYYVEEIDVTDLIDYLEKLNKGKEKHERITLFHAVVTGISKTIYNRPLLNRFIAGRRFYDRNEISLSFVAKNKLEDNAEERLIILNAKDKMTLTDVSNKILDIVSKTRNENTNDMNDTLGFVTMFPRFMVSFIMWCFRKLDYYGMVPHFISDGDPNYTTILLSNLGSVGADCCYHHLNNYGTNSIVATIGVIHEKNKRKYINIGFTLDERIADGVYFARSIKLLNYILTNPELLNETISTNVDIDCK